MENADNVPLTYNPIIFPSRLSPLSLVARVLTYTREGAENQFSSRLASRPKKSF